jgi:uncharacterized membrane protein YgaE (UPF0421/DUF939 family)
LAAGRLVAFIIALLIAAVSYRIFGFTQLAFWIYIIPYVFICYLKKWTAAITINSVLVSHFLNYQSMDMTHILNEVFIFVIGVSVGILMNLNLHHKEEYIENLKNQTDDQIVKILKIIAHRILDEKAPDYHTDCFREMEHLLREAKNAAEENYNNRLRKQEGCDIKYIAMRQRQYNVLLDMYKTAKTIETKPNTAQVISDFFEKTGIRSEKVSRIVTDKNLATIGKSGLGRKEGYRKPIETKKEEYREVLKLLRAGYPIRKVAKLTEVSESTIKRLKKEFAI